MTTNYPKLYDEEVEDTLFVYLFIIFSLKIQRFQAYLLGNYFVVAYIVSVEITLLLIDDIKVNSKLTKTVAVTIARMTFRDFFFISIHQQKQSLFTWLWS